MEQMILKFLSLSGKLVILKERQLVFGLELVDLRRQCEIPTGYMTGGKTKQIQALIEICPCPHPQCTHYPSIHGPIHPSIYCYLVVVVLFICLSLILRT